MVVVKGAAHMPNIEQNETFDSTVLGFLDSH